MEQGKQYAFNKLRALATFANARILLTGHRQTPSPRTHRPGKNVRPDRATITTNSRVT
jgi:hypothetical protein